MLIRWHMLLVSFTSQHHRYRLDNVPTGSLRLAFFRPAMGTFWLTWPSLPTILHHRSLPLLLSVYHAICSFILLTITAVHARPQSNPIPGTIYVPACCMTTTFIENQVLFIQGGTTTTSITTSQFLMIDLTQPWDIDTPAVRVLSPNGPNDYQSVGTLTRDKSQFLIFSDLSLNVFRYTIATDTWDIVRSIPYMMVGPGNAVTDPETGLIYAPNRYNDSVPSMLVYNPVDNSVSKADMHPDLIGNKGFSAVWSIVRKSILVYGGLKDNITESGTLYEYQPGIGWSTPVVQGDLPGSVYRHRMVPAYNGKIMVLFGGVRSKGEIHFLDTNNLTWSAGVPGGPIYAREYPACATSGDMFVVWGGKTATNLISPLNVTGVYNMREKRWQRTFEPPNAGEGSHPVSMSNKPNLAVILGCIIPAAIFLVTAIVVRVVLRRRNVRKQQQQHAGQGTKKPEQQQGRNMRTMSIPCMFFEKESFPVSAAETTSTNDTPKPQSDPSIVGLQHGNNDANVKVEVFSDSQRWHDTLQEQENEGCDALYSTFARGTSLDSERWRRRRLDGGGSWMEHYQLADDRSDEEQQGGGGCVCGRSYEHDHEEMGIYGCSRSSSCTDGGGSRCRSSNGDGSGLRSSNSNSCQSSASSGSSNNRNFHHADTQWGHANGTDQRRDNQRRCRTYYHHRHYSPSYKSPRRAPSEPGPKTVHSSLPQQPSLIHQPNHHSPPFSDLLFPTTSDSGALHLSSTSSSSPLSSSHALTHVHQPLSTPPTLESMMMATAINDHHSHFHYRQETLDEPAARRAQQQEEYMRSLHQDILDRQRTLARLQEEQERQLKALHGMAVTATADQKQNSGGSTLVVATVSSSPSAQPIGLLPLANPLHTIVGYQTSTSQVPAALSPTNTDTPFSPLASSSSTKPRSPHTIQEGPMAFPILDEVRGPHSPAVALPVMMRRMSINDNFADEDEKEEAEETFGAGPSIPHSITKVMTPLASSRVEDICRNGGVAEFDNSTADSVSWQKALLTSDIV